MITPSPLIADDVRQELIDAQVPSDFQVVTINRWLHDTAQMLGLEIEQVSKSKLILNLSTIWKMKGGTPRADLFFQAFELLTELRSYSTDFSHFDEVMVHLPHEITELVKVFWQILDYQELHDEHFFINQVTHQLRSKSDDPVTSPYLVIYGFGHLNGNQIDLIKTASIHSEVIIPYRKELFNESKSSDYIRWLLLETPKLEIDPEREKHDLEVIFFPANRMAESLKTYLGNEFVDAVVCGQKDLSMTQIAEIPLDIGYFKANADIFSSEVEYLFGALTESLKDNGNVLDCEVFTTIIDSLKKESLTGNQPNFRRYKICTIAMESYELYKSLSDVNENLTNYDLQILKEVVALDSPRVYIMQPSQNTLGTRVHDLRTFSQIPIESRAVVCVQSGYGSLKRPASSQSFDLRTSLASIGPVRNNDIDFLELKLDLIEFLKRPKARLFMEKGLEESEISWKEILDHFNIQESELSPYRKKLAPDLLAEVTRTETKRFSASRLQAYKDCPRKYYYQYLEKTDVELTIDSALEPSELGELEHAVIEKAWKTGGANSPEVIQELSFKLLKDHLQKKQKKISESEFKSAIDEITVYATNGLNVVSAIAGSLPDAQVTFEYDLINEGDPAHAGFIDCLIRSSRGLLVLDFKRSKGSIPGSGIKLSEYEKVQLWYYLRRLKVSADELIGMGYITLADIEDSLLISGRDEGATEAINSGLESLDIKFKPFRNLEISSLMTKYGELEDKLISDLQMDHSFVARPVGPEVCTYCPVTLVCPKHSEAQR